MSTTMVSTMSKNRRQMNYDQISCISSMYLFGRNSIQIFEEPETSFSI